MQTLPRDLRYALRQVRKSPGFTFTAVLTLALGVGANTAIFSVVYGLLLQSLPFRDATRIVNIFETHPQVPGGVEATYPDYQDWRTQQKSFEQIAAYSTLNPNTVSLVMDDHSEQVHRVLASGNFFSLLGVSPLIGRTFGEQDDKPGSDHVAVLSAGAWQRYFGRDPGVVGRNVNLNGTSYNIVGVLPPGAAYPTEGEVWLPLSLLDQATQASRVWHSVNVLGRLRPGIELAEAKADMQTIAGRIAAAYPATNRNVGVLLTPLREQLVGTLRPAILSLMGSVVLVLLIACANVANLLMVRATANRREVAVRQALGADRIRLYSQFLAQTLILCLLGGALGTILAALALPLLRLALSHTSGARFVPGPVDRTQRSGAAVYARHVHADRHALWTVAGGEDRNQPCRGPPPRRSWEHRPAWPEQRSADRRRDRHRSSRAVSEHSGHPKLSETARRRSRFSHGSSAQPRNHTTRSALSATPAPRQTASLNNFSTGFPNLQAFFPSAPRLKSR